jgi:prepilin-type processing-associated H-X9-DG protein
MTTKDFEVRRTAETLMFADTAMGRGGVGGGGGYYQEYSFAEPRYFVFNGEPYVGWDPAPSIHFRHRGKANIGWVDGHVDSRKIARFEGISIYGVKSADMGIGWFEPMDNSLFDLE